MPEMLCERDGDIAAVRIGMSHLDKKVNGKPVHMVGYSTGAPLALEFALDALEGKSAPVPHKRRSLSDTRRIVS